MFIQHLLLTPKRFMKFGVPVWMRGFVILALVQMAMTGCEKPAPPLPPPTPTPTATPTPVPTPTPIPALVRKPLPTATLFNGLALESAVISLPSNELASTDRKEARNYTVEVTIRTQLPRPATTLEDIEAENHSLPSVFKNLPELISGAHVSPFFKKIYELKTADIRRNLSKLDAVLTRHNFYDCETILELQNPVSSRRALLILADMDVNTDGSDGDRNVKVDGSSSTFLPQTSYRWPKQSERPNPFLSIEEKKVATLTAEAAQPGIKAARAEEIKSEIDLSKRRIYDMKKWSFLIADTEPFIVLPGFIMRDFNGPFVPKIGDYAVVIYNGKAYPAIVGDSGPSQKIGEASMLLCREINSRSSNIARPVSDLKVAYLVFPGSGDEKNAPPDLIVWREKCYQLTEELGGLNVDLHVWPNLVPPWPTPTPTPSPEATPEPTTPSPEATPASTPSPTSTPEPTPVTPGV
jgi:hypothetical protein